jgi:hypothetical protein
LGGVCGEWRGEERMREEEEEEKRKKKRRQEARREIQKKVEGRRTSFPRSPRLKNAIGI